MTDNVYVFNLSGRLDIPDFEDFSINGPERVLTKSFCAIDRSHTDTRYAELVIKKALGEYHPCGIELTYTIECLEGWKEWLFHIFREGYKGYVGWGFVACQLLVGKNGDEMPSLNTLF